MTPEETALVPSAELWSDRGVTFRLVRRRDDDGMPDQDDLRGALALMEPATKRPKAVRDFHLRQWYVLADLYDRTGDPISARRWFATILEFDDEFGDARDRLRSLGR